MTDCLFLIRSNMDSPSRALRLIQAYEVTRTPQGSLTLGNESLLVHRTGSGRLRVSLSKSVQLKIEYINRLGK